jgi:hypothetical protein
VSFIELISNGTGSGGTTGPAGISLGSSEHEVICSERKKTPAISIVSLSNTTIF